MKNAIFLDRDGVICKETNLFYDGKSILAPEDFEWETNAKEGLASLARLAELNNFLLVLATGQSAINKGLLSIEMFHEINKPIYEELKKYNRRFDGIYFCPHRKEENCECRKPKTGMLLRAKRELGIDLTKSYVVGDKTWEVKMGRDAGCKTILVRTGYAGKDNDYDDSPDFVADDLLEASYIIDKYKF